MQTTVKFAKVKPDAKIPSKRKEDMAFDIYACFEEDYIVITPHETKLIPTGIASSCEPEYGFLLRERGSTGSKGIALRCGVLDSGYRNEWFVALMNSKDEYMFVTKLSPKETLKDYFGKFSDQLDESDFTFYPYSKAIAQALVIPVPEVEVEELIYEDLQAIPSERGLGALGSSGK